MARNSAPKAEIIAHARDPVEMCSNESVPGSCRVRSFKCGQNPLSTDFSEEKADPRLLALEGCFLTTRHNNLSLEGRLRSKLDLTTDTQIDRK